MPAKANPIIALAKKLATLQERNEKLQSDIAACMDAITAELEKQSMTPVEPPAAKPATKAAKPAAKPAKGTDTPKRRGRPPKAK